MAILVECDICGAQQRVKDTLSGRSIPCKECGVQVVVDVSNLITEDAFVEENGRLRRLLPGENNSGGSWLGSACIALLIIVTLIVVVWLITIVL